MRDQTFYPHKAKKWIHNLAAPLPCLTANKWLACSTLATQRQPSYATSQTAQPASNRYWRVTRTTATTRQKQTYKSTKWCKANLRAIARKCTRGADETLANHTSLTSQASPRAFRAPSKKSHTSYPALQRRTNQTTAAVSKTQSRLVYGLWPYRWSQTLRKDAPSSSCSS